MDDSSSSYGESIFSSKSPSTSNSSIIPPRGEEIDRWQRHIRMQEFAKDVQRAAESVYPNSNRSRYSNVYVLIFKWETEDPKLPVQYEIDELRRVLEEIYGYEIEIFEIPDHKSHAKVVEKITAFIAINDDSKNDLKIVYYAGHSRLSHTKDLVWSSSNNQKCSTVTYTGIQHSLEQAESDVLILLDSCSSGIGDAGEGHGVTELMAACAFDTIANGVGHYSFTKALTTELRFLSQKRSFPVVELYTRVYCRAQHHMPQGIKNERHPAPIHLLLTRDDLFPRGLQLSIQERSSAQNQENGPESLHDQSSITEQNSTKRLRDHDVDILSNKRPCLGSKEGPQTETTDPAPERPESSQTVAEQLQEGLGEQSTLVPGLDKPMENNSSVPSGRQWSASQFSRDAPRLLFSVRLQENIKAEDMSVECFADWLRIIPAIAEEVTVEGVFKSDSTLVLLALPFQLWPYLSPHPAVVNLGPIRSSNILIQKALNHWSTAKDRGPESLSLSHLDSDMAHPDVTTMNHYNWFPEGGQGHPGFSWTTLGPPKIPFDFDPMDDNESDLWTGMPGTYSEMGTEYEESIFDAPSLRSGSQGRSHSVSSSRRQKTSYFSAPEMVKAANKVGPCWRCRFLRKICYNQDPCRLCSRPETASLWATIGCRRGPLMSQMPSVELCPVILSKGFNQNKFGIQGEITSIPENDFLKERIEKRNAILTGSYMGWMQMHCGPTKTSRIIDEVMQPRLLELWMKSAYPKEKEVSSPGLEINSCLLDILWEIMESPSIKFLLHQVYRIDDLVHLVLCIAQYQTSFEINRLIRRSFFCFRSALEAMATEMHFIGNSHQNCNTTTCSINCITNLDSSITLYLEEFSQVFFMKENQIRSKERWWLSMFYSFCIQSMVRAILMELVKSSTADWREHTAVTEYLNLPVQLFAAVSGSYDPLVKDPTSWRSSDDDGDQVIFSAQIAVGQKSWKDKGISGSIDYLKRLFGQRGGGSGIKTDLSKSKGAADADE